jgi:hypothetical protein
MNEVKRAFIEAYERAAEALAGLLGNVDLPDDVREAFAELSHADHEVKARLQRYVIALRDRAAKVRRGDVSQGDWPLFRPEDAAGCLAMYNEINAIAASGTKNEVLLRAIQQATRPLYDVVDRYADVVSSEPRFPADSADPLPPFEPPPDPNIRKL